MTTGLRQRPDPAGHIRFNLGECVTINFTNQPTGRLFPRAELTMSITLAVWSVITRTPSPQPTAAQVPIASHAACQRPARMKAYYFWQPRQYVRLTSHGLSAPWWSEPPAHHVERRQPSNQRLEAIIVDPSGSNFRQFTLLWHEIGDEKADIERTGNLPPVLDQAISGAYRPACAP